MMTDMPPVNITYLNTFKGKSKSLPEKYRKYREGANKMIDTTPKIATNDTFLMPGTVVTIDGPAGSGKSTVAKLLAERLHFDYLDTGGMYRAAALLGLRAGIDLGKPGRLAQLLASHRIEARDGRTFLDGEDVSDEIRTEEVTRHTHYSADDPEVRAIMVRLQRQMAKGRRLVTEGRDQGTVVFPETPYQFYLTATPECRARRRLEDIRKRNGGTVPPEYGSCDEILAKINLRDQRDAAREVGPLRKPENATVVDTDDKTIGQVVDFLVRAIQGDPE